MKTTRSAVLCDFDGTVTNQDVTDEILKNFAPKTWTNVGEKYLEGKISHMEMNRQFARIISVTPAQLRHFLKSKITLRDGFRAFARRLSKKDIPLVIVSSGWDFYIREILGDKKVFFLADNKDLVKIDLEQINIISNKIRFNKQSQGWELTFPWQKYSCNISSPCKGKIRDLVKKLFYGRIVSIGDSRTDVCMLEKSDKLYSTGELSLICDSKGFTHQDFTSFEEVGF